MINIYDKFTLWFMQWLCYWCRLIDGVIGIITLNLVHTTFTLNMAKKLARYRGSR